MHEARAHPIVLPDMHTPKGDEVARTRWAYSKRLA
ncbi:hypothetical protein BH23ACI1_BH23ACI1_31980 [soil metagenome]